MKNKILLLGLVLAVLIIGLIGIDIYQKYNQRKDLNTNELLKASKEKIVNYEFMKDENGNNIIAYLYASEIKVPQNTYRGLKEDMTKRTENSQSFLKEVRQIDYETAEEKYVSKFYSGPAFSKEGDDWYQIETATTTPQAFFSQTRLTILDHVREFFGKETFAATDTTYSGVGDGYLYSSGSGSWNNAHDASSGIASYNSSSVAYAGSEYDGYEEEYYIGRIFLPFNTSGLPDDNTILSASLYIYAYSKQNDVDDDFDYLTVVQTTQDSNTSLTSGDFDQCGAIDDPTVGINESQKKDLSDISIPSYIIFDLNSTGISWISKTGYTKLGIREGHDVEDENISPSEDEVYNGIYIRPSEYSGTDNDPYLEITYGIVVESRIKIDTGKIKIDSGKIKID